MDTSSTFIILPSLGSCIRCTRIAFSTDHPCWYFPAAPSLSYFQFDVLSVNCSYFSAFPWPIQPSKQQIADMKAHLRAHLKFLLCRFFFKHKKCHNWRKGRRKINNPMRLLEIGHRRARISFHPRSEMQMVCVAICIYVALKFKCH